MGVMGSLGAVFTGVFPRVAGIPMDIFCEPETFGCILLHLLTA